MTSPSHKALAESAALVPQLDGAPPAYERHEFDEIYTTNDAPDHRLSLQPTPLHSETPSPITAAPLSLTMDNSLIYPTVPPSTALYHIPQSLFFHGDRVYLQRSVPRESFPSGKPRRGLNEDLYELRRIPYIDDRELALIARSPACYGTSAGKDLSSKRIRRVRGLLNTTWEVVVDGVVVLKGFKNRWKHASALVAREEMLNLPLRCHNPGQQRLSGILEIQAGVEQRMQDLVVAAWCGKIWLLASDSGVGGLTVSVSKKWDKQQRAVTNDMYSAADSQSFKYRESLRPSGGGDPL
ncbi:MAG: hypothetical protein LQ347_003415 [Umbilicaria vellea]|nr:MAG: hypothetical protein LQ347_003415 [Umbilicaria vellea]